MKSPKSSHVSGWSKRALKDCATWYSGGTPRKSIKEYWNGDVPWISAKSLVRFFIHDSLVHVTNLGVKNGTRLVPKNTILFIVRGMSLKKEFRMGITTQPVTFNQDLKALVPFEDILPLFLAYSIKGRTSDILELVGEAGHGTGVLPTDRIESLLIDLPPFDEQKRIAHVLGILDDKIELNRKMNKTLEAMAQALFKSWFVDFDPVIDNAIRASNPIPKDLEEKAERRRKVMARESYKPSKYSDIFPDSFVDSELGFIPKGWDADFLDNIIEIISGGTPKRSESKYWGGKIPWFSVRDAPSGSELFVTRTKETISEDGLESCSANLVPSWTTIISARGTVGKLALTTQEMTFNQSCYGIRPSLGYGKKFVYFTIKNTVELLKKGAHGSVFDTITRKTFEVVRIVKPPTKNSEIFESHLEGILRTIKLNVENSNHLSGIRDTLLPKLIAGKIRVPKSRVIK